MPTHMLANKTALEIIQELNAPLNLLKDLDLDIHKGNSIMRMMGHQATMDTAAAGQFVRDHPEEAKSLLKSGQIEVSEMDDLPRAAAYVLVGNVLLNLDETLMRN